MAVLNEHMPKVRYGFQKHATNIETSMGDFGRDDLEAREGKEGRRSVLARTGVVLFT